jgi:hypothetical protein
MIVTIMPRPQKVLSHRPHPAFSPPLFFLRCAGVSIIMKRILLAAIVAAITVVGPVEADTLYNASDMRTWLVLNEVYFSLFLSPCCPAAFLRVMQQAPTCIRIVARA